MTLDVKKYHRKPDRIEAVRVTPANVEDVARWCGGEYHEESKPGDPSDVSVEIIVPTLTGNHKVRNNGYVVKSWETGRFSVFETAKFLSQYEEDGVRLASTVVQPDMSEEIKQMPKLTPHYVARGQHPFGN